MKRRTTAMSVVVALIALVAAPACGIGDRQEFAERIHRSRAKVAEAPAAGVVTFELTLDEDGGAELEAEQRQEVEAALAAATATGKPSLTVHTSVDLSDRRARLVFDDPAAEPSAMFVDTEVFVRRRNARPTERRTWAKLDLGDVVGNERALDMREMSPPEVLAAVASTVNPVFLVELVEGTLSGSVEVAGDELIADVSATRYNANISFDKAMTELDFDDDERAVRMRLFRLLGSRNDVVPASIWLDDDGRLRRLRIELDQHITRRRVNRLTTTVEFTQFGAPVVLDPPGVDITVTYERFGRLVRSALPEGT